MVGPSLELIDLVNGSHEGRFLFTEFCFFPTQQGCTANQVSPASSQHFIIFLSYWAIVCHHQHCAYLPSNNRIRK
jgi:hypothetical protein